MSVMYFLKAKSGIAKKSSRWFGMALCLAHDQYGEPAINTYWFESADQFEKVVSDLVPGCPCRVNVDGDTGKITSLYLDDRFEPLEFAPEFFERS